MLVRARSTSAGSSRISARPSTGTTPSATAPKRPQGRTSTRGSRRSRLTLPDPNGVSTTSAAPSRATHTGVDTEAPDRRKVVSEMKRSSARLRRGSTASRLRSGRSSPVRSGRGRLMRYHRGAPPRPPRRRRRPRDPSSAVPLPVARRRAGAPPPGPVIGRSGGGGHSRAGAVRRGRRRGGRQPRLAVLRGRGDTPRVSRNYRLSLDDLERGVRVPRDAQIEAQDVDPPREYLEPEDLDRVRLLASPAGASRLEPRG